MDVYLIIPCCATIFTCLVIVMSGISRSHSTRELVTNQEKLLNLIKSSQRQDIESPVDSQVSHSGTLRDSRVSHSETPMGSSYSLNFLGRPVHLSMGGLNPES